jgi:hypothetical protein
VGWDHTKYILEVNRIDSLGTMGHLDFIYMLEVRTLIDYLGKVPRYLGRYFGD